MQLMHQTNMSSYFNIGSMLHAVGNSWSYAKSFTCNALERQKLFRSLCVNILKQGPIPEHVGFIMDGNRRFAKKMHVDRAIGHVKGFEKLEETLEWCHDFGVKVVTVYAFSIENFKRSRDEVDGLMELAKEKLLKLVQKDEIIQNKGICVRILGDVSLLRPDVREAMSKAVELSKNNRNGILNVCFPYTSRHELAGVMKELAVGVASGKIQSSDIDEELVTRCLYTQECTPPDLLVRTSGEVRLSDFLLWQSSDAVLSFLNVLWPEFSLWDLVLSVLHYQHARMQVPLSSSRDHSSKLLSSHEREEREERKDTFVCALWEQRRLALLAGHGAERAG
eukprot:Colp12_sorted_trinity150504_noHs@36201